MWNPFSTSVNPKQADTTQLQNEIDQANANSLAQAQTGQGLQGNANQYYNQANRNLIGTQANMGMAQGAIHQANQAATGGNVANSLDLLQAQANGTAPTAATGMLQQGTDQAIAAQQAMANSGNVNNMMTNQKSAMDNAATLQQQNANQAAQLQANQQMQGQQAYAQAAEAQAAQLAHNAALQQNQTAARQQQSQIYGNLANQAQQGALGYGGLSNQSLANAMNQQANIYNTQQGTYNQAAANNAGMIGGLTNAAGGAATMYGLTKSDERAKEDIKDATGEHGEIKKFLDSLQGVSFQYKEPNGENGQTPGEHIGILAQHAEKTPVGKTMVVDTPQGKMLDNHAVLSALLASVADLNERLDDHFASKKKKARV
jgi:hypothetical protein